MGNAPFDGGRVQTRLSFNEKQVADALMAHYNLPTDSVAIFDVQKEFDCQDRPCGTSVIVQVSFKQVIPSPKGKNA